MVKVTSPVLRGACGSVTILWGGNTPCLPDSTYKPREEYYMSTCFIIQPFDGGKFDKRYTDIIAPAINETGLEPYRVDEDPNVSIPINDIESGIRDSVICLADITLDNPNVWFELGYAFSANKPVVMICSNERETKFPFDVQHRSIIKYSNESPSDFEELKKKIISRINALLKKEESLSKVSSNILADVEGLNTSEIITIAAIAENLDSPNDFISTYIVKKDVEKSGFTKMAAVLGLKTLSKKDLVTFQQFENYNGEEYTAYTLTENGWDWVIKNQDQFQIRKPISDENVSNPFSDDDIPF